MTTPSGNKLLMRCIQSHSVGVWRLNLNDFSLLHTWGETKSPRHDRCRMFTRDLIIPSTKARDHPATQCGKGLFNSIQTKYSGKISSTSIHFRVSSVKAGGFSVTFTHRDQQCSDLILRHVRMWRSSPFDWTAKRVRTGRKSRQRMTAITTHNVADSSRRLRKTDLET